jgi:hypothetical protein
MVLLQYIGLFGRSLSSPRPSIAKPADPAAFLRRNAFADIVPRNRGLAVIATAYLSSNPPKICQHG